MRLVVADTGPLNYLILIEAIDLLPKLFETIFIPTSGVRRTCACRCSNGGTGVGRASSELA